MAGTAATTKPDLAEFYRLSKPKKPPCKVGIVLGTGSKLSRQERTDLQAALAIDNNIITGRAIIEWIDARNTGFDFSPTSISNHRRGTCSCAG